MEKIDKAREILQLGESATIVEIQKAYRRLSLKYHPDKCGDGDKSRCEGKFKEINSANETLRQFAVNYRIPLTRSPDREFSEDRHMKAHIKRFYDGWLGDI